MVHIHIYTFSTKNFPHFFLMLVLVVSSLLIKEMD